MTLNDLHDNSRSTLKKLYENIKELLKMYPNGLTNFEIANKLGLESSHENAQRNYLTYSLLGNMMEDGIIKKTRTKNKVLYVLGDSPV